MPTKAMLILPFGEAAWRRRFGNPANAADASDNLRKSRRASGMAIPPLTQGRQTFRRHHVMIGRGIGPNDFLPARDLEGSDARLVGTAVRIGPHDEVALRDRK